MTRSERETFLLARKLAKDFNGQEVVLLEGELGAGKTIFAKGIASGLGLEDVHQVCSPSYTIVNIYYAKISNIPYRPLSLEQKFRNSGPWLGRLPRSGSDYS